MIYLGIIWSVDDLEAFLFTSPDQAAAWVATMRLAQLPTARRVGNMLMTYSGQNAEGLQAVLLQSIIRG